MNVNAVEIKNIYQIDKAAKALLDMHLAKKQNRPMPLDAVSGELGDHSYAELVAAARRIEETGVGTFIVGRKSHPTRIEWRVSPSILSDLLKSEDKMIEHVYAIRRDLTVKFTLPVDLTPVEAERLSDFVRTLYFA